MQVQSLEIASGKNSLVEIADGVFDVPYNEALLHQVVVAQMAGMRAATAHQKNRSAVRGGGRKPWKQKGTGRARAGTTRSPIWRGGGRVFPAGGENYHQKVNKKMWAGAMRTVLAELLRQGRLQIIQQEDFSEARSKNAREWIDQAGGMDFLLVMGEVPVNLFLSLRNFPRVGIAGWQDIGPADLLQYGRVLMDQDAVMKLGEVYG
ncbi:50S ribosomal protein L4 [Acidithiobacillus albertensis]|uniref:50S ribosomal protein L4 n=1 Tax=Acidithiobacillus albertensis TaxID=119978 RepID=UPI00094AA953|nr:50S ribosomal protein L4 [Acidithiobacillus albertensis]